MSNVDPSFIAALRDISVCAPELPQEDAFETLERIREYERNLILPNQAEPTLLLEHYANGAASYEDELRIYNPNAATVLTSADHATDPVRKATGVREGADHGTAGLVRLLVEREDTAGIIPIGMQTGNATVTPGHPVKQAMDDLLPGRPGFLLVHGMRPAKLEAFTDPTEIHTIIGMGSTPNEQSRAVAEELVAAARELGLRAVIGNDVQHMTYDTDTDDFEINPATGNPKRGRLAALGAGSTANHAYRIMEETGVDQPAFQVEMTRALRLLPSDFESGWHADEKARAMGVYSGYLLMEAAVEIMSRER